MYQELHVSFDYHNNPVVRVMLPRGGSQASVEPTDSPQSAHPAGGAAGRRARSCLALPTSPARPHSPGADLIPFHSVKPPLGARHAEAVALSQFCADGLKA